MPELRHILLVGEADPAPGFDDALAGVGPEAPLAGPEDVVVTMPTGGTTGMPKLVRMSQRRLLIVSWNTGTLMGPEPETVVAHGTFTAAGGSRWEPAACCSARPC